MSEGSETTPFGRLLRQRRTRRDVTQERLAYRADLSPRHVSFLETGRSNPSRSSVLALSRALDLPLRDRNALLRAAGFAAVYPERDPLEAGASRVRSLFSFLLRRHEPFPAFVVDRRWTVRMHNRAATDLLAWLLDASPREAGEAGTDAPDAHRDDDTRARPGSPPPHGAPGPLEGVNLLGILFDPKKLRPLTVNFEAVGRYLWDRLEEEIALCPDDERLRDLRDELEGYGPLPGGVPDLPAGNGPPALPVHLRKDGVDLRLLSFLLSVAAPREVGVQEIRMETFLPADEESEALLREGGPAGS